MIKTCHLIAMLFAFGRLIELFGIDRITANFRKAFPSYLWSCPRCLSVWAGIAVTLLFYFYPWANWPLALSWLWIAWLDRKQAKGGRVLKVSVKDGQMKWHNELDGPELMALFNAITIKTEPSEATESAQSST
jgi:hypothetical protein